MFYYVAIASIPYLPVYNAHPYFKACFQGQKFQRHSWWKIIFWNNSAEIYLHKNQLQELMQII